MVPCAQRDRSPRLYSRLSRLEPLFFLSSSSSIVLMRPSALRSRPTGRAGNRIRGLWICSQELLTIRPQKRSTFFKTNKQNKLRGLSPRANYTDRATAACRRNDCQLLRIEGATWSAWRIPTAVFSIFQTGAATFLSSSSSVVLTRLGGPRSRPTTSQKIW
jgi:hypothetical protein